MYSIKQTLKQYKFLKDFNRTLYRFRPKSKLRKPILSLLQHTNLFSVLERNTLLLNNTSYKYKDKEPLNIGSAFYLNDLPSEVKDKLSPKSTILPEAYIVEVPNASLRGKYALGFNSNGQFIRETSFPYFIENKHWHTEASVSLTSLIPSLIPNKVQFDTVCSLINEWNNNYFHWITVTLTKLEGLKYYEQLTGIRPKLLIHSNPTKWQLASLQLMGYSKDDLITWTNSFAYVNKLLVPTFRKGYNTDTQVYRHSSPQASKWVANTLIKSVNNLDIPNTTFSERVYISRSKATGRQISNESELTHFLSQKDFKTYILEDMSFEQQVKLFSQAKVLIAPHGAGLINMVFSSNLTLVELCGKTLPTYSFAEIARGLGFTYSILTNNPPSNETRTWDGDIQVDLSRLNQLLELVHVT